MRIGYNPTEAKAAAERLRKQHEQDKKFLEAQRQKQEQPAAGGLGFRIEKAKARRRAKTAQHEEAETLKAVAAARRKEDEALRRARLSREKTAAEQTLQVSKQAETQALQETRAARRARLLSEQELRRAKREPYVGALRAVGKGAVEVGKVFWRGAKALDAKNQEYARTHPPTRTYTSQAYTPRYAPRASRPAAPRRLVDFDPGRIELDPNELMR